jgi:hypothetical protein
MTTEDKTEIKEMILENNKELIAQIKEIIIDVNQHTVDMLRSEIRESESGTRLLIQDLDSRMQLGFEGVSHQIESLQTDVEILKNDVSELKTDMYLVKQKLDIHSDQIMTH